jgi:hypothetical protein
MTTQLYKYTERLRYADRLIRLEATGTPRVFARKLNISESYLYGILDEMKLMGLPLAYSKTGLTYYYTKPVRLRIEFGIEELGELEVKEKSSINGGNIDLNTCTDNILLIYLSHYDFMEVQSGIFELQ